MCRKMKARRERIHALASFDPTDQDQEEHGKTDTEGNCLVLGKVEAMPRDSSDEWEYDLQLVDGAALRCKLDTGADCNAISLQKYHLASTAPLKPCDRKLRSFFGHTSSAAGVATLDVVVHGKQQPLEFVVVDADVPTVLGRDACSFLGLVQRVHTVSQSMHDRTSLIEEYADVFSGLGAYDRPYDIQLDPDVAPVVQPRHKVPYAHLEPLREALRALEEQGVIASVDRPTDWVQNLVVTENNNGTLRICIDPKPLNKAIKRERFQIPTPEDVQFKFSGAQVFSVVDMKDSYWQVVLSERSSYMCTFHTPWGRKRFLRMPFGISSASEVLQKRNEEAFADIPCVHIIADDIIVAAPSEEEHDQAMQRLLQRARKVKIRFNKNKFQYKVPTVTYMGNVVSSEGLRPCPDKVKAIASMPTPEDKTAVKRFLGMIQFLSQFLPNLSHVTLPLRNLLRDEVAWEWTPEANVAFKQLKEAIARPVVLKFFETSKPVTVEADASQCGLGCCLLQDGHPVAYASRALTKAEEGHSQIEKEMLAICFACARFHQYVYGVHVDNG
jgi:hypothetical protein